MNQSDSNSVQSLKSNSENCCVFRTDNHQIELLAINVKTYQLYRFCYSLTVDETSAYDLLQNSLEKFLKSNTEKENDLVFMYRIIRHQFIDDYRKQSKHQY